MAELSDTQMRDLIVLVNERVRGAFDSVDQLVEIPEQSHLLLMSVIAHLTVDAASFMSEHACLIDGEQPSADVAYFEVLAQLARLGEPRGLKKYNAMREKGKL